MDVYVLAVAAFVCLWLSFVLGYAALKWVIRRELRRMLSQLRDAKFVLVRRDPKTGRWTR